MVRVNDRTYFTEKDKVEVVYREYSKAEVEEHMKQFKKKWNTKRIVYMVILCLLIVMTQVEQLEYIAGVVICFMLFLIILEEITNRLNVKVYSSPYYIEIQVDKKLPRESYYDNVVVDGGISRIFCPIEGHDTTSGYQSVFYIDWQEYLDVEAGSKIKMDLAVIGDDLPSAPDNVKN